MARIEAESSAGRVLRLFQGGPRDRCRSTSSGEIYAGCSSDTTSGLPARLRPGSPASVAQCRSQESAPAPRRSGPAQQHPVACFVPLGLLGGVAAPLLGKHLQRIRLRSRVPEDLLDAVRPGRHGALKRTTKSNPSKSRKPPWPSGYLSPNLRMTYRSATVGSSA